MRQGSGTMGEFPVGGKGLSAYDKKDDRKEEK
jgi:hypothetical protein